MGPSSSASQAFGGLTDGRSADEAELREWPEAEEGPSVDVLLRDLSPAAAVVAAGAVVAEDVVVALGHHHRLVRLLVTEAGGHVALVHRPPVHQELAPAELDGVAGKADHPLDERHRGVLGVPEHHHVAAVDAPEAVDELVHD